MDNTILNVLKSAFGAPIYNSTHHYDTSERQSFRTWQKYILCFNIKIWTLTDDKYKSLVRMILVAAYNEKKHNTKGFAAYQWFWALGSIFIGYTLLCQIYNILHKLRQSIIRTPLEILGKCDHGTETESKFCYMEIRNTRFKITCSNNMHKCLNSVLQRSLILDPIFLLFSPP